MKKIAIAGYHFTGSGVIDDLFREFDNVCQPKSDCESRFLQDMDGISDLEFHLVNNPNRLYINQAIERFLRYCKNNSQRYEKIYGSNWYALCVDYINSLVKFQYVGYNLTHLGERSQFYPKYVSFMTKFQKLKPSKWRNSKRQSYFPKEKMYHAYPSEVEFLEKTRSFVDSLVDNMPKNKEAEYVMIDQMFGGNNPDRYLRYVNDVKAFVVDRDPRDLFINQRNMEDHIYPPDPHQFCVLFRDIRKQIGKENPNVMFVKIEDMIYKYDEYVAKVCDFVGIDMKHHVEPKKYFDPSVSIKGTKTWERFPQYAAAVKTIEEELPDFLYNYSE